MRKVNARHEGDKMIFEPVHYDANRVLDCINACAGMADPAKEIAALRAENKRLKGDLGHEILEHTNAVLRAKADALKGAEDAERRFQVVTNRFGLGLNYCPCCGAEWKGEKSVD
jgi:hypothetical protein